MLGMLGAAAYREVEHDLFQHRRCHSIGSQGQSDRAAHLERAAHLRDDLRVAVLLAAHLVAHGERRADVRDDRAAARLERVQVDKACADIATPDAGVGL